MISPDPETALRAQRATLITYLRMKLETEDWHGVQDAASDIREIETRLDAFRAGVAAGHAAARATPPTPTYRDAAGTPLTPEQQERIAKAYGRSSPMPAAVPAAEGWTQDR